jgi:2-oxoglutarate dehydrogenase E2 component (dihydrolipoamide succinyltransferase)
MFEVKVPTLGESITEAVIVRWAKGEGEAVRRDEVLLEVETDKASTELPAERSGVLHIVKPEGETVQVGDVIARIDEQAAATDGARGDGPARPTPQSAAPEPPRPATEVRLQPVPEPSRDPAASPSRPVGPLSPAVRGLIEEHRLDPAAIQGTGKGGRITKGDVLGHLETRDAERPAPAAAAPAAARPIAPTPVVAAGGERVEPMSRIRRRIAERLVAAQHTAAILTTFNEIDMSAAMALRARWKEQFSKRHGIGLGFMSIFAKAAVAALAEIPGVNAEIRGEDVVYRDFVHLGVAVGTPRGLVVPVVRHAEARSFAELEQEIARLAGLARDGKLAPDDLAGGTFTISNGGVYGSLLSTPILNPPQSGILGMHKIEKRPVVVDDQIVIRPMMYVALSYDHRLVDGEQAVTFLVRVKERIEEPTRLLLDV